MGGIMGKSWNDYIKVITLPLAVWILWDLASFVVGIVFASQFTAAVAEGADATGAAVIIMVMGLVGLLVYAIAGLWIGWNTVKMIKGSYIEAAVAAIIAAVIATVVSVVLGIISSVIAGGVAGLATMLVGLLITGVIGLILACVIVVILAVIGVFIAKMMGKR